jgi:uncharacterized protein (TIGR03067 family)
MKSRISAVVIITALVVSAAAGGDDAKKELERFQGVWTVIALEEGGEKAPEEITRAMGVEFKGDVLIVSEKGKVVERLQVKLDPGKKPKALDLKYLTGEDKGKTELGIYALEGDTLKICVNSVGKERPKDFTTAKDNEQSMIVLRRKK